MRLIVGMHRSGSSIISLVLKKLGLNFSDSNNFIKADKFNKVGYFEDKNIIKANMYLLQGIFWKFNYFFKPCFWLIERKYKKKKKYFDELELKYANKFVKDNRFCLTLRYWPNKVDYIIIILRNPIDIAKSLKRRYFLPISIGLYIWRYHILSLFKGIKRHDYLIINFDNLKSTDLYKFECKKIVDFVNKREIKNYDYNSLENIVISNIVFKEFNRENKKYSNLLNYDKKYYLLWNLLLSKYG